MAYFTHDSPLAAHTLVRAAALNAIAEAIETSFGLLPTESEIKEDRHTYSTLAGSANVYTVTSTYPITAYTEGFHRRVKVNVANTGASTINFDGLGAKAIKRITGDDLEADDLVANSVVDLSYNGTVFIAGGLLSDSIAAAASATAAAASASAAATSASEAATSAAQVADSLDDVMLLDGSNVMTADMNMGGFRITNLVDGTALSHAARVTQLQKNAVNWGGTVGGTADALTLTLNPVPSAYQAGMTFRFIIGTTNTEAVTLDVNSLGTKSLKTRGDASLAGGELVAGAVVEAVYDGTAFRLTHPVVSRVTTAFDAEPDLLLSGLRSDARRITLLFDFVSTNGTDDVLVQLGDATGGLVQTGYEGVQILLTASAAATAANSSGAIVIKSPTAATAQRGQVIIEKENDTDRAWHINGKISRSTGTSATICTSRIELAGVLDRINIVTSGTDDFDSGSVTMIVEE